MYESSNDGAEKSFRIKHNDKFFTRLLERDVSLNKNSSFRVNCAVPFTWESQPGTPKQTFCDNTIPPLTPPPSFYSSIAHIRPLKKHSRSSLLHLLLRRLMIKKFRISSISSSGSSSPRSAPVTPSSGGTRCHGGQGRYASSFDPLLGGEEDGTKLRKSALCFGA